MIYTLFIYQSESGVLMYEKIVQEVSSMELELFNSFFLAIKSVISNLVSKGSNELKNIELGNYLVTITSVPVIKTDVVLINDKEDKKIVDKLIPKIIKILLKNKEIFINWNGQKNVFSVLDEPIIELLLSNKKLLREGASLLDNPEQILKSIWEHEDKIKGKLAKEVQLSLINRKDFLLEQFNSESNILRKTVIANQLLTLSEKLKDENAFLKFQKEIKLLNNEVKDIKLKLDYYLTKAKKTLSDAVEFLGNQTLERGDYKEAYINLYSFSTKLKLLTSNQEYIKYRDLAMKLMDKENLSHHELSSAISSILRLNNNIEEYLN